MNRFATRARASASIAALCWILASTAGCYGDAYGVDPASYPSAELLASEDPVYFDGEANYFNDGVWYFQRGGRWSYYRSEPDYLRNYRLGRAGFGGRAGRMGSGRVGGGRVVGGARGGGRGGRGGGRGGGHGGRR
jgi:hypothetical protein